MKGRRPSRRLAAVVTLATFAAVLGFAVRSDPAPGSDPVVVLAPPRADWPMLGGSLSRNMANADARNVPSDWRVAWNKVRVFDAAGSRNVKWVAKLGSRTYGGPVVAGGRLFVGTNNLAPRDPKIKGDKGILMCFDAATGRFLWQAVHDKLSAQVNDWPREGMASSPSVAGDFLYYVSNRCELVCARAAGKAGTAEADILWRLDMMKELNVFPHNLANCSPLVVGDLVFAVTGNGVDEEHINVPSPDAPSFVAVDRKTGKLKWKDSSPGKNIMHGQWSNPVHAVVNGKGQVIFPGGDGWLYAFEPRTGKPLWKFDANPKNSKFELGGKGTKSDFIATPVVVGDRLYIGTGQDPEHYEGVGHLWCIDITRSGDISPELVLDAGPGGPRTRPNRNSGVVWHYGGPVAKQEAGQINRDYYFGRTMSTVAVHDGLLYAAELAGYLHCLDARTGKRFWTHDLKAGVWGSAFYADNRVHVATEDGDIWIFAHGREKKLLNKAELEEPVRTTPVALDGVLYVASESHLYAIGQK
jgi:outer membrane protein assembly factor BamB